MQVGVNPEITKPRWISKSQFKAHALALFREIETSGEPLVVTDHGRPALEVRPYRPAPADQSDPLVELRGSVLHYNDPFAPVAEGDWEVLA